LKEKLYFFLFKHQSVYSCDLCIIRVCNKTTIAQISLAVRKMTALKNCCFRDACGVKIHGCEESTFPKRGKRKGPRKGGKFSFSWRRDVAGGRRGGKGTRKRKRVLPMFA